MRSSIILFAVTVAGCQLLLPDLNAVEYDAGSSDGLAANGEGCAQESDCESGHCLNNVCCNAPGECCNENVGCGNLACDLVMFACYTECAPGGDDQDEYCAEGFHCDTNVCQEDKVTGDCDEGSDCVSDECIDYNCCEHAGLCCGGDQDCPEMFDGCSVNDTQTCVFSPFSFPDTGQADECYNSSGALVNCSTISPGAEYYGQDGHYPGPGRLYDNSNSWVIDQITGLAWMWQGTDQMDWENASSMCDSETAGSMTWRLPKRHELLSIVDYRSGGGVGADPVFGFDASTERVWTGSGLAGEDSTTAWAVNFDTGGLVRVAKSETTLFVICVTEN